MASEKAERKVVTEKELRLSNAYPFPKSVLTIAQKRCCNDARIRRTHAFAAKHQPQIVLYSTESPTASERERESKIDSIYIHIYVYIYR